MHDNDPSRKRAKATNVATLRAVVAVYLIYLGGSLVYEMFRGNSVLPPALVWTLCLVFAASGAAFGLYTWRRWKADTAAAASEEAEADGTENENSAR